MQMRCAGFIKALWSAQGDPRDAVLPGLVAPDSQVEFVFHLGSPWRMNRLGLDDWTVQPHAFIYAQSRRCLQFTGTGPVDLVAFRVSPVVARVMLGRSLSDLWDQPIPLQDLVGSEAHALLERLSAAPQAARYGLLAQWTEKRLRSWDAACGEAQRLFDEVMRRRYDGTIQELADTLGLSVRSLRRILANSTGLSPKDAQLSGRLGVACTLLRERRDLSVTEIAGRTGFFDHAAFTHAFSTRLGLTPRRFRDVPEVFYERIEAEHDVPA